MDSSLQLVAEPERGDLPPSEQARLRRISDCVNVIDGSTDQVFDGITALAANIFDAPISTICVAEEATMLFIGRCGFKSQSAPRDGNLCNHALECDDFFVCPMFFATSAFRKTRFIRVEKGSGFMPAFR